MKRDLTKQRQPFGEVMNEMAHKSTMSSPATKNMADGDHKVGNRGMDQTTSFSSPNPGAESFASRYKDNPFEPVGENFRGAVGAMAPYAGDGNRRV